MVDLVYCYRGLLLLFHIHLRNKLLVVQTQVLPQTIHCQFDKDLRSEAVGAIPGVGLHRVALLILHHHRHFLYFRYLQMGILIWYLEFLILLIESSHIGAVIGKPDQLEDMCPNHILQMIIGILHVGAALDPTNLEMATTITIMGAGVIQIEEIMGMPEMFTCIHRELLQGAL